jgi:hypothetical protein
MSDRTFTVSGAFGSGVVNPIVTGIPANGRLGPKYIKRIQARLHLVLVCAGANAMLPGRRMMEAIQSLSVNPVSGLPMANALSGWAWRMFQLSLTGRSPLDPADVPANTNATVTMDIPFVIPYQDRRALSHKDGGVPTPFLAKGAINLNWQGAAYFGASVTIDDATKLYLDFVHGERFDVDVGERVTYEAVGVSTFQNLPLVPGQITDAILIPTDGAAAKAFDENSFSTISFDEDGDPVHSNTVPDDLIDAYNEAMVSDSLSLLPTLDAATTEFIPLVWPGAYGYTMGDRAYAASQFNLLATVGSGAPDTDNYQVLIRRILPADVSDAAVQVNAAAPDVSVGAAQLGFQVAGKLAPNEAHHLVKPATDSEVPLTAANDKKQAIYGRFMRREVSPTNIKAAAEAVARGAVPAK